jgi:hypothetical protein
MKDTINMKDEEKRMDITNDSLNDIQYCKICGKIVAPGEQVCAKCAGKINEDIKKAQDDIKKTKNFNHPKYKRQGPNSSESPTENLYHRSVDMRNDELPDDDYNR